MVQVRSHIAVPFWQQSGSELLGPSSYTRLPFLSLRPHLPSSGDEAKACKKCKCDGKCKDWPPPSSGGDRGDRCFLNDDDCKKGLYCQVGKYACSEESNPSGRCEEIAGKNSPCPMSYAPVCESPPVGLGLLNEHFLIES